MKTPGGQGVVLVALWLAVVVCSLATRPLFPVDETRYLAVAWEMWQRQDFLVPWLNGQPYSDKPPLLFWLIHLVWSVTGVEGWSARLVAPVLSLCALYLVRRLAAGLWPDAGPGTGRCAVWLTFANLFWLLFLPLVQFDLLLVDAALLAWTGLLRAPSRPVSGWTLTGLAIGLGVLAKGPVILVFVLPPLLLAPLWLDGETKPNPLPWRWYAGGALSVALGAGIALAWAMPAGDEGGAAYRTAIFWGQSTGRIVDAFAHRSPWWSYVWMLPLLCVPWLAWPRLWRAVLRAPAGGSQGDRFVLAVLLPALLIFSAISGKQVKYLLPLLPLIALWLARRAARNAQATVVSDRWFLAALPAAAAALILVVPAFAARAAWLGDVSPYWALPPVAVAVACGLWRPANLEDAARALALVAVAIVVVLNLAVAPAARASFDLGEISRRIGTLQARGVPVAYLGRYQGQFHFPGRLRQPVAALTAEPARDAWVAAHPQGYLVEYRRSAGEAAPADLFSRPWRGGRLVLWPAGRFAAAGVH